MQYRNYYVILQIPTPLVLTFYLNKHKYTITMIYNNAFGTHLFASSILPYLFLRNQKNKP